MKMFSALVVSKVCSKTFPGDAVVQVGRQLEISPTRTGRGVFVYILLSAGEGKGKSNKDQILQHRHFYINNTEDLLHLHFFQMFEFLTEKAAVLC